MPLRIRSTAAAVAVCIFASCGGSGAKSAGVAATTTASTSAITDPATTSAGAASTTSALRPAGEVRAERQAARAAKATIGQPTTIGKLTVNVSAVTVGGDDSGKWLLTKVRFENPTSAELSKPQLEIYCASNPKGGGYQVGSTIEMYGTVPAGSFDEGVLNLLLPGDSRTGSAVPECRGPAVVRASGTAGAGVDWTIPDDTLVALGGTPGEPSATTAPASTSATAAPADDAELIKHLLTIDDLPSGWSVGDNSNSEATTTAEPAECVELLNVNRAKPSSAKVTFQQSSFGPFLFEVVVRYSSSSDAKTTMATLDAMLGKCGTFTEIDSNGTRTAYQLKAMSMKKFADDTWASMLSSTGAVFPVSGAIVAVRKGPYLALLLSAAVGSAPATLDEALVSTAAGRLP